MCISDLRIVDRDELEQVCTAFNASELQISFMLQGHRSAAHDFDQFVQPEKLTHMALRSSLK